MTISLSHHRIRGLFLIIAVATFTLLSIAPAAAAEARGFAYFQGLLGAADFDEDQLTFTEPSLGQQDPDATNDLSTMPYLGFAGQYPLYGREHQIGIDASLLIGWHSDDTSIVAGNGQARVEIDSDLWLVDLAIGLYAQTMLGDRWRLYAAAGPMMLFGEYSHDTTEEDPTVTPTVKTKNSSSDSAFGVGGYAKLGMEYRLSFDAFMGIAVRGIATNLEFDQAIDNDDLKGLQGFVTFTRAY